MTGSATAIQTINTANANSNVGHAQVSISLLKEYRRLHYKLETETNYQAHIETADDNMCELKLTIRPTGGLWRGARYHFDIELNDYPRDCPTVRARDEIFHPNIAPDGEICLNILGGDEWSPSVTIEQIVHGILFLFYQPNMDDPLHDGAVIRDEDEMREAIVQTLHGRGVDDLDDMCGSMEGEFCDVTADPEWDFEQDRRRVAGDDDENENVNVSVNMISGIERVAALMAVIGGEERNENAVLMVDAQTQTAPPAPVPVSDVEIETENEVVVMERATSDVMNIDIEEIEMVKPVFDGDGDTKVLVSMWPSGQVVGLSELSDVRDADAKQNGTCGRISMGKSVTCPNIDVRSGPSGLGNEHEHVRHGHRGIVKLLKDVTCRVLMKRVRP